MLAAAEQFLEQQMHPTVIIRQYKKALEDIITLLEGPLSVPVDKNNKAALANVVSTITCYKISPILLSATEIWKNFLQSIVDISQSTDRARMLF